MPREPRPNPNRGRQPAPADPDGGLIEQRPEPPPLPGAVPHERDDGADAAALQQLVAGRYLDIINAPLPEQNLFLHGYRQSDDAQLARMRRLKDIALVLWQEMHEADGTKPEIGAAFHSREMGLAALRLEEAMLWVEKHFNV